MAPWTSEAKSRCVLLEGCITPYWHRGRQWGRCHRRPQQRLLHAQWRRCLHPQRTVTSHVPCSHRHRRLLCCPQWKVCRSLPCNGRAGRRQRWLGSLHDALMLPPEIPLQRSCATRHGPCHRRCNNEEVWYANRWCLCSERHWLPRTHGLGPGNLRNPSYWDQLLRGSQVYVGGGLKEAWRCTDTAGPGARRGLDPGVMGARLRLERVRCGALGPGVVGASQRADPWLD